jgi:hypothetical protein
MIKKEISKTGKKIRKLKNSIKIVKTFDPIKSVSKKDEKLTAE